MSYNTKILIYFYVPNMQPCEKEISNHVDFIMQDHLTHHQITKKQSCKQTSEAFLQEPSNTPMRVPKIQALRESEQLQKAAGMQGDGRGMCLKSPHE